jgi:hypothetical protein
VFIVCICNTAVFKLIPLMCTHVDSYMFSTVHPQGINYLLHILWEVAIARLLHIHFEVSYILKHQRTNVLISSLTPYYHISLPCMMRFDINARIAPTAILLPHYIKSQGFVHSSLVLLTLWIQFYRDLLTRTFVCWIIIDVFLEFWVVDLLTSGDCLITKQYTRWCCFLFLMDLVLLSCLVGAPWNRKLCLGDWHNLTCFTFTNLNMTGWRVVHVHDSFINEVQL